MLAKGPVVTSLLPSPLPSSLPSPSLSLPPSPQTRDVARGRWQLEEGPSGDAPRVGDAVVLCDAAPLHPPSQEGFAKGPKRIARLHLHVSGRGGPRQNRPHAMPRTLQPATQASHPHLPAFSLRGPPSFRSLPSPPIPCALLCVCCDQRADHRCLPSPSRRRITAVSARDGCGCGGAQGPPKDPLPPPLPPSRENAAAEGGRLRREGERGRKREKEGEREGREGEREGEGERKRGNEGGVRCLLKRWLGGGGLLFLITRILSAPPTAR